jgi:hypothetical protein
MKPTHFLTMNARTGQSRITPLARVENRPKPEADAKPSKAHRCTCGKCGTGRNRTPPPARPVPPFDPVENTALARRLDAEAAEAAANGDAERAAELRERALLCHDLTEVHDREEARKAATATYVRAKRFVKGILTPPGVPSALDE